MLSLRTFGGVALFHGDRALDGPATQRRRFALLSMLAVAGEAGVSRDKLIAQLWPESDADRARHALRQWIFLVRRDLGVEDVVLGAEELRLNPQRIATDVADFLGALARGDDARAVEVYAGPFLDGFHLNDAGEFERWLDGERGRFAAAYATALQRLAAAREATGDIAGAVDAWRRLASAEPLNARVTVRLMESLDRAGDRGGALAHARVHASLVREELGADPDPSVARLAERIRHAPTPASGVPSAKPQPAASESGDVAIAAPIAAPDRGLARPSSSTGRRRRRRRLYLTLAALPIVSLGLVGASELFPDQRRATLLTLLTRGAPAIDRHLMVVAPLENRTGDTTLDVFGEMAADNIAHALESTGEFQVADARTSILNARIVSSIPRVFRAGDRAVAIAEETGAGTVITGRYYRDGDSLRVQVQMIDVPTRRISGSAEPVTGKIRGGGSTRLVEIVTQRVLGIAVSHLDTTAAGRTVASTAPPSFEAYREASRAWESYYSSNLPQFFRHASAATELDTGYMLPIAMQAHVRSEMRQWSAVDSLVGILRAHRRRLMPVELAALDLAEAELRGDLDAEYQAAAEVARAAPASPETRTYLAHMAVSSGRPAAALGALAEVDPRRGAMLFIPWYWNWITAALHERGEHSAELSLARRGLRQFPGTPSAVVNVGRALAAVGDVEGLRALAHELPNDTDRQRAFRRKMLLDWGRELDAHGNSTAGRAFAEDLLADLPDLDEPELLRDRISALVLAGRWSEANSVAQRLVARTPNDLTANGLLGVTAAGLGDTLRARRIATALERWPEPYVFGRHTLWRARIAAVLGDRDRAVALAEAAMTQGHPRFFDPGGGPYEEPEYHIDPALRAVRDHPSFRRFLAPRE